MPPVRWVCSVCLLLRIERNAACPVSYLKTALSAASPVSLLFSLISMKCAKCRQSGQFVAFAVFSLNVEIPFCFSYNYFLLAGYRRPHDGHAEQMVVAAPAHSLPRDSSQVLRRQPQVCTVQQRRHRDLMLFDLLLRLLKRGGTNWCLYRHIP